MTKLTPLQKDRLRKFLAALRSGKYRQGKNALAQYDPKARKRKFCCLGVACEVALADGVKVNVVRDNKMNYYDYGNNHSTLPLAVREYYGFDSPNPDLDISGLTEAARTHGRVVSAALVNDDLDQSFRQIADLFEKTYLNDETDA